MKGYRNSELLVPASPPLINRKMDRQTKYGAVEPAESIMGDYIEVAQIRLSNQVSGVRCVHKD